VSAASAFGQTETITEDLPALVELVRAHAGDRPQHWIAHSWGGVLLFSCLARFPELLPRVASITCFGTKRSIAVGGFAKFVYIDLLWNRLALVAARRYGYLPAVRFKLGADNESRATHEQCVRWVDPRGAWVDPADGFDYGAAIKRLALPRTLHFAGVADRFLGHPHDVRRFADECGTPPESIRILSRAAGNRVDYGHIDMLTHPEAERDHFPDVVAWLRRGDVSSGTP
jgi:pimeloyl-ACP methyl ester carboxylesterase